MTNDPASLTRSYDRTEFKRVEERYFPIVFSPPLMFECEIVIPMMLSMRSRPLEYILVMLTDRRVDLPDTDSVCDRDLLTVGLFILARAFHR